MIVKVAELDKNINSSFRRLTSYIMSEQIKGNINVRNIGAFIEPDNYSLDDLDTFIEDIESVQSQSKSKNDKTYHLIVSFPSDERPDIETLKNISNELVESLGFKDHQRLSVIHDDTDNLHMHIAINKIDPDKFIIKEPYYPYKTLSKKARELENKYNLNNTHSNDNQKDNICSVANDIDSRPTMISFKSYVEGIDLSECKSWEDFHDRLRTNGIGYSKYGSGAVFKDLTNDKINIKASAVKREYSLKNMENKYGEFKESTSTKTIETIYNKYQDIPLKEQYDLINTSRKLKSKQEKQIVQNEYMQAQTNSGDIIDNLSRVAGGSELDRLLIRLNKKAQAKARQEKLRQERKNELKRINEKYKYYTYESWLQQQALVNEKAEQALKNLKESRINYIKGDFTSLKEKALKITKNGTYILDNKLKANYKSVFLTPKYNNIKKAIDTLKISNIMPDTLNGTDEFKEKVINIIAVRNIDITFKDDSINEKIQEIRDLRENNLISYINERNNKIPNYAKFDGTEKDYTYLGYVKYNDKFFIKFKSLKSNTIYVKEPVSEDYSLLKEHKQGDILEVNTPINDTYEVECFVDNKEQSKINFKEIKSLDNSYKRISTKEYNNQKVYLYKKDNDKNIYVSNTYLVKDKSKEQENKNENNKSKNRDIER